MLRLIPFCIVFAGWERKKRTLLASYEGQYLSDQTPLNPKVTKEKPRSVITYIIYAFIIYVIMLLAGSN